MGRELNFSLALKDASSFAKLFVIVVIDPFTINTYFGCIGILNITDKILPWLRFNIFIATDVTADIPFIEPRLSH